MEVELLKMIPGGGTAIALVALVVLFLNHIKALDERQSKTISEVTSEFREHISKLTDQVMIVTKETSDAVRTVSKETSTAIRGLEDAVRILQSKSN